MPRRLGIRLAWGTAVAALVLGGCSSTGSPSHPGSPLATNLLPPTETRSASPSQSDTHPHGVFTTTGSLALARPIAAATLLRDGSVLVIGGVGSAAEIYSSETGDFRLTGSPVNWVVAPELVLLRDGRVLLVNASEGELYDPASGVFTVADDSTSNRGNGEATALLSGGEVLVAGGAGTGTVLRIADLYDPATGKFIQTGSMKTGRACLTATTLQNGRVLVAGGDDGGCSGWDNIFGSAEIYDPHTHEFTPTGSMTTARTGATGTLLDNGKVLIAGGVGDDGPLDSAELYDPTSGKFTATGSMSVPRASFTATLLADGQVLIAGGGSASAELYNPATGRFTRTGSMKLPRYSDAAVRLNDGRVLILGGVEADMSAELYWP